MMQKGSNATQDQCRIKFRSEQHDFHRWLGTCCSFGVGWVDGMRALVRERFTSEVKALKPFLFSQ